MKHKMIVLAATILPCAVAFAQTMQGPTAVAAKDARAKMTKEERRAAFLAHTGGPISYPVKEPGVCFLNCQNRLPEAELGYAVQGICTTFRKGAYVRSGSDSSPKAIKDMIDRRNHVAVVAIVDEPGAPTILTAPDERWARINIAPLTEGNPDPKILALRVNKQMWRAFAFVAGGAFTTTEGCLLKPAATVAQLDAIRGRTIGPDSYMRIHSYLTDIGCSSAGYTTYRRACEEGWAPAPTNDVQKTIWKQVHEMPSKPIRIKPETKKVKE